MRQAVRLISSANRGGLSNIDSLIPVGENENGDTEWKTTREVLLEKHPHGCAPAAETLLTVSAFETVETLLTVSAFETVDSQSHH